MRKDGKVDTHDGKWYCNECWAAFEEVDEKDEIPASSFAEAETVVPSTSSRRTNMIRELFDLLDKDKDRYLNCQELQVFATFQGFDGSEQEWRADFNDLCKEYRLNATLGVPKESFELMIEDESDSGCYCDDSELEGFLKELKSKASSSKPVKTTAHGSSGSSFATPPGLEADKYGKQSNKSNPKTPLRMPKEDNTWQSGDTWWQDQHDQQGEETAWWQKGHQKDSWKTGKDWTQDAWNGAKDDSTWWDEPSKPIEATGDPWHDESDPWQMDPGNDPWQQGNTQQSNKGQGKGKKGGDKGKKSKGSRASRPQQWRQDW